MDPCTVGVDNLVMTTRTLVILALLVAGLELEAQTSTQRPAPVGVLVGIHKLDDYGFTPGPPIPAALRTVWLDTEGSATPALPRLLVPRSSGFWWLGLTSTCSEQPHRRFDDTLAGVETESSDALWASPTVVGPILEAHDAAWNCRSADVFCGTHFETGIYWVWPDFISMNRGRESGCGAHLMAPSVQRCIGWTILKPLWRSAQCLERPPRRACGEPMIVRSWNIVRVTATTAARTQTYSHQPLGISSVKEGGGSSKAGLAPIGCASSESTILRTSTFPGSQGPRHRSGLCPYLYHA
jgi:hypothetical protein